MKKTIFSLAALAVIGLLGVAVFIYSGAYNMGADEHHWNVTTSILEKLRERSIEVRASELKPPNLNDQQLILKGAGQYAAMCVECHLAPGKKDSEIRPGLYPQPPNLALVRVDPRVAFWALKHGIKMSGMPAWGIGHDDATLWSIAAFVNKLPDLTPQAYKEIVARAPPDEEMESMTPDKNDESPKRGEPMEKSDHKDSSQEMPKDMNMTPKSK